MPALEPDVFQQSRHASRQQAELIRIQYDALVEQELPADIVASLIQTWWQFLIAGAHNAATAEAMKNSMHAFFAHLHEEEDDED